MTSRPFSLHCHQFRHDAHGDLHRAPSADVDADGCPDSFQLLLRVAKRERGWAMWPAPTITSVDPPDTYS
jgi:hypothetical protein